LASPSPLFWRRDRPNRNPTAPAPICFVRKSRFSGQPGGRSRPFPDLRPWVTQSRLLLERGLRGF